MNENQKRCQQEVVRRELLEFEKRTIRRKGSRKARSRLRRLRFNLYSEFTSALSFSALHFYGKGIVLNCHVAYYILSNRSIFVPVLLWVRCNPTLGSWVLRVIDCNIIVGDLCLPQLQRSFKRKSVLRSTLVNVISSQVPTGNRVQLFQHTQNSLVLCIHGPEQTVVNWGAQPPLCNVQGYRFAYLCKWESVAEFHGCQPLEYRGWPLSVGEFRARCLITAKATNVKPRPCQFHECY